MRSSALMYVSSASMCKYMVAAHPSVCGCCEGMPGVAREANKVCSSTQVCNSPPPKLEDLVGEALQQPWAQGLLWSH